MNVECRKCGALVPDDHAFCPECGALMVAEKRPAAPEEEESAQYMTTIPSPHRFSESPSEGAAGAHVEEGRGGGGEPSRTAPASSLPTAQTATAPAESRSRSGLYFVIGIVLVLLLGGLLFYLIAVILSE